MSERVVLHPFEGFELDDLGESSTAKFGPDVEYFAFGVSPGGSYEAAMNTDTPVETTPTIWFRRKEITAPAHSEWTVRGKRYAQDGEPSIWRSPRGSRVGGTSIRLKLREG